MAKNLSGLVKTVEDRVALGWPAAWVFDTLRRRITEAPARSVALPGEAAVEIHAMTSVGDWLNLVWTLQSFFAVAESRDYALCIHDDGSLSDGISETLQRLFPGARIIRRAEADAVVLPWLQDFPRCQMLRRFRPISFKEFDFAYFLSAGRGLLFDSDLLFFAEPTELLRRCHDPAYRLNTFNADVEPALACPAEELAELTGLAVPPRYNSGLGLYHRASLERAWFEEFLAYPRVLAHPWRFEQTLHALASTRHGVELLPADYDVYFGPLKPQPVVRHYVGAIRAQMYSEGMTRLAARLLKAPTI